MKLNYTALTLTALMCAASVAGYAARPNAKAANKGQVVSLETIVPK